MPHELFGYILQGELLARFYSSLGHKDMSALLNNIIHLDRIQLPRPNLPISASPHLSDAQRSILHMYHLHTYMGTGLDDWGYQLGDPDYMELGPIDVSPQLEKLRRVYTAMILSSDANEARPDSWRA